MAVTCEIVDYKSMMKDLKKREQAPRKAMQALASDVRKRGPGWIAQEVVKEYGVSKAEVTGGKLGKVRAVGSSVMDVELKYKGHLLTPTHFNMDPTAPIAAGYKVQATILKGKAVDLGGTVVPLTKKQRQAIGRNRGRKDAHTSPRSPVMLMRLKGRYLPVKRVSQNRKAIEVVRTVSLPQMVTGRASEGITKKLNTNMEKRLNNQLRRYLG